MYTKGMHVNQKQFASKKKKPNKQNQEQICSTQNTHMVDVFLSHNASLAEFFFFFSFCTTVPNLFFLIENLSKFGL